MAFHEGEMNVPVTAECRHVHCEHCHGHEVITTGKPGGIKAFGRRLAAAGLFRFAGWWAAFAGFFAMNSVCPICGSSTCPVGIGTTGVLAALFAAVKQWGGKCVEPARRIIRSVRGGAGSGEQVEQVSTDMLDNIEKG